MRLLADPTANQPGPLADGIAVWIEAFRLLLTEATSDSTREAPVPDAKRVAETILTDALGQALLQIGIGAHLPR